MQYSVRVRPYDLQHRCHQSIELRLQVGTRLNASSIQMS